MGARIGKWSSSSSSSRWRAVVVGAVVVVLASLALGSETAEAAGNKKKAQALYREGAAHYEAGDYEEALASFTAAYDEMAAAGLLFNIGQCHRQLKHHKDAVEFFERYLEEQPEAPNRAEVEELAAQERSLLPAAKAAVAVDEEGRAIGGESGAPAAVDDPDKPLAERPLVWGIAAAGAAALLAGAAVIVIVATAPQPLRVEGSLGEFDLRGAE